jgi:predicted GNAT family acetyltransferase
VIPPRPAPGGARIARESDRATIVDWFQAFVAEALPPGRDPASRESAEETATYWIGGGGLWVWIDGGLVAMAGASGRTPNGIRVGAVFTPPEKRRRGYASSLVAALSQAQLDAGRRFCFLYTDLANRTSNRIYQDIGYEPVCDVDEYRFEGAAA